MAHRPSRSAKGQKSRRSGGSKTGQRHGHRHKGDRQGRGNSQPEEAAFTPDMNALVAKTAAYLKEHLAKPPVKEWDPFALDPWQQEAVDSLTAGHNVIVDAPTTAGKTRVIETFFRHNIDNPGFRAAYTTPVKSLSNDKVREFREMFGHDKVGIATGDIKDNLDAPIVVATLESYRNSLLGVEPDLGRKIAVFDEYHFVQDISRGSSWEEAIILSPPTTQILLLSASVDNPMDFCEWLEMLKPNPCRLIKVKERPVPLQHLIFHHDEWVLAEGVRLPRKDPKDPLLRFPLKHDELAYQLAKLERLKLTPCIIYAGSRLATESIISQLLRHLSPQTREQSQRIKDKLDEIDATYGSYQFLPSRLRQALIMYGVAYHHSGVGPGGRIAVEILLKNGMLRYCSATMGLSIGINFAVRSALISDYRRPGSNGFVQYDPSEVLQMLGRAGRRGQDLVGFSLWPNTQSFGKFMPATRESAYSQLRNDPATYLGLVSRGFGLRQIEDFYQNSFLKFKDKKVDLKLVRQEVIGRYLNAEMPCVTAAHEYSMHLSNRASKCSSCPLRERCHNFIDINFGGSLAKLQIHLHRLGALNSEGGLTDLGEVIRFFPQAGGMVFAEKVVGGEVGVKNLLAGVELMAALTLARFKEPLVGRQYKFPFDADEIEERLEEAYPQELFPEMYDPPFGRRHYPVIREYNPAGGYILREWALGAQYKDLVATVCHEKFAPGDVVNLIYRTATYLQSLAQTRIPELSRAARSLWVELMRPPLRPEFFGGNSDDEDDGDNAANGTADSTAVTDDDYDDDGSQGGGA